jgi:hypothetical protein
MNSLAEIEAAIASLSREEQVELRQRLMEKIQPTCYELSKDFFEEAWREGGSGVGDLSTNKKHMEGFGRPERRFKPKHGESGQEAV